MEPLKTLFIFLLIVMTAISCSTNSTNELPVWNQYNPPPDEILDMTLDIPSVIGIDQTVTFRMKVTNTSEDDLIIHSLSDPYVTTSSNSENQGVYDFIVTDQENRILWSKFYQEAIPDLGIGIRINSGETIILEHEWDESNFTNQTIKPGAYKIIGTYLVQTISNIEEQSKIMENINRRFTTDFQEITIK